MLSDWKPPAASRICQPALMNLLPPVIETVTFLETPTEDVQSQPSMTRLHHYTLVLDGIISCVSHNQKPGKVEQISSEVFSRDKVVIVGDFNIDNDSQMADKTGSLYKSHPDLVLSYGIDIEHLIVLPQNLLLSDHHPITFDSYYPIRHRWVWDVRLIHMQLNSRILFLQYLTQCHVLVQLKSPFASLQSLPKCITLLVGAAGSMQITLDSIAHLKEKEWKRKRSAVVQLPKHTSDTALTA